MATDVTPPVKSGRWELNQLDWAKWIADTIVFFAPAVVAFLTVLQAGGSLKAAAVAFYTWALGAGVNLFKKLYVGDPKK